MGELVERAAVAERPARAKRRPHLRRFVGPGIGLTLLLIFLASALLPGLVAPYDPEAIDYMALLQAPSWVHPFGTDNLGRDLFSRVIWAAQVDLQLAIFCTLVPVLLGTFIGALIGYYGGFADALFGRLVDFVITLPFLVLVIAIVAMLGPGLLNLYLAVSVVGWVFYARLMRGEMMVQKRRDYAAAGKVMGFSTFRIIFGHLVPNAITPIVVYWMTDLSLSILLGSSLGYLGLGAQPPTAEWGVMIADGKNFMTTAWWMSIFPGLAIIGAGTGFSLLGDGLAEWLRPK